MSFILTLTIEQSLAPQRGLFKVHGKQRGTQNTSLTFFFFSSVLGRFPKKLHACMTCAWVYGTVDHHVAASKGRGESGESGALIHIHGLRINHCSTVAILGFRNIKGQNRNKCGKQMAQIANKY